VLDMLQTVTRPGGTPLQTTRCPIRIDGEILTADRWAPLLGQDNASIDLELDEGDASNQPWQAIVVTEASSAPLDGCLVLDFSQFLSGPSAGLRLADLGARVIKIEHPERGDLCRRLYISDLTISGDSSLFHAINRNKESFSANLKHPTDLEEVWSLVAQADVIIQNFRPGVMDRLGFGYDAVKAINPKIVYGSISGYGDKGPWRDKPGQDLLVQALSGLPWQNGHAGDPPVPFGLSVADLYAGAHLVEGLIACLYRCDRTGHGGLVEVSLLESIIDFQFEVFTAFLNGERRMPRRSAVNNAHSYLGAPYGIYKTSDTFLALAMGDVAQIGRLIGCEELASNIDSTQWFRHRDVIKSLLRDHLATRTTAAWLEMLESAGVWCAEVLTWDRLVQHPGFIGLEMTQSVMGATGVPLIALRCPIRIDSCLLQSEKGAPQIGQDREAILQELGKGMVIRHG